jgi:hypothetical protein
MKASLVAYDGRELQKKLEIKIINYHRLPKRLATQIGLLKILGINGFHASLVEMCSIVSVLSVPYTSALLQ